jgi:hypothetical protein
MGLFRVPLKFQSEMKNWSGGKTSALQHLGLLKTDIARMLIDQLSVLIIICMSLISFDKQWAKRERKDIDTGPE